MSAGLFGLKHSNRDLTQAPAWGKNIFNATFPIALVCYMAEQGLHPRYLILGQEGELEWGAIDATSLFGVEYDDERLYFDFESRLETLSGLVETGHQVAKIDLVTRLRDAPGVLTPLRGLEVKLTVVPDSSTSGSEREEMAPEIVVRPPTIEYLALSIIDLYQDEAKRRDLFAHLGPACGPINHWHDQDEVGRRLPEMVTAVQSALVSHHELQVPVVVQPIWRTIGTTAALDQNCFDVFVWSNWSFTQLFLDATRTEPTGAPIKRHERTTVWLVRLLWDFSRGASVNPSAVFDVGYGTKNDKAFSLSGKRMLQYLRSPELEQPRITNLSLREIILGGGEQFLSPERRLDAAIWGAIV